MGRILMLRFLLFAVPTITFGQIPKDYFNKEVQSGQGTTTKKIIRFLEKDRVDLAMPYFSDTTNKTLLLKASADIRKIQPNTKGGYVIVYEEGYNIYRYRYANRGIFYLIDLYFNEGDPNSKVVKVITKDKAELDMENENMPDDFIPPPPKKQ